MSEPSERHPSQPNRHLAGNRPNGPEANHQKEVISGDSPFKGLQSLEFLRNRVELVAEELFRLREENLALAGRVRELEKSMEVEGTVITFQESPEVLKRKIAAFIEAVDRYMEGENE